MENLTAGSQSDTFDFSAHERITGIVHGKEGVDFIMDDNPAGRWIHLTGDAEGAYHCGLTTLAQFISIEISKRGLDFDALMKILPWEPTYSWINNNYIFLCSNRFGLQNTGVIFVEEEDASGSVETFDEFGEGEGFPLLRRFKVFNRWMR